MKQTTDIRYVSAKLSKFVQVSTLISPDSFLQRIPWKLKRAWNYIETETVKMFIKEQSFIVKSSIGNIDVKNENQESKELSDLIRRMQLK